LNAPIAGSITIDQGAVSMSDKLVEEMLENIDKELLLKLLDSLIEEQGLAKVTE
jgi:hypothetical protein